MAPPDPLAVMQQLIAVLDEGRRTSTYKLATLLALIDCAAAGTDADGRAASVVPTRELARRTIELYWPQTRAYPVEARVDGVLRQSSQARAITVAAVEQLRRAAEARGLRSVAMIEQAMPDQMAECLDTVELNLVRMPLGKLQRPAGWTERSGFSYPRFLYDDSAFTEGVTARQLRAQPFAVELREGVADVLVTMAGLIRPLLELQWTRDVARYNALDQGEDRLREFLFGASRVALGAVAPPLLEAQHGSCFYCRRPLGTDLHVDHFVPWSRLPNDALANLVLAHARCNNAKRDHLASLAHVERWAARPQTLLAEAAARIGWAVDTERTFRLASGLYAHQREGAMLWVEPGVFEVMRPERLADVLPLLAQRR